MKRLWHALICLFRTDCELFQGDDYTTWARTQERESIRAARQLRDERRQNFWEAEIMNTRKRGKS